MITVGYITGRKHPRFDWFLQSLARQPKRKLITQIVIVDFYAQAFEDWTQKDVESREVELFAIANQSDFKEMLTWVPPKPNIWAGPHRITKENWWHASAARNTAICLARGDWFACVDDRSVLMPGWLASIRNAIKYNYAVCGAYEKRIGMVVEDGVITTPGTVSGQDNRLPMADGKLVKANGNWWYGCTTALKTEWALKIGGYPEDHCDGISMEDVIFGQCCQYAGLDIRFDPSMMIVEDRSPQFLGKPFRREDKGVSPNDKSHQLLHVFANSTTTKNSFNIREVRDHVLAGNPFPLPTASHLDWYDGQPISEFK